MAGEHQCRKYLVQYRQRRRVYRSSFRYTSDYSTTGKHYMDVKVIDLAKTPTEEIESTVDPKEYGIDTKQLTDCWICHR